MVSSIRQFAEKNQVASASFYGIGAADRVKVGVYSESLGSYLFTDYRVHMEISSLTGNIFPHEGKPFVHAHGVFSSSGGMSLGGHVAECEIARVCEIHLTKLAELKLVRKGALPLPRLSGP